jgi:hypothetical protein
MRNGDIWTCGVLAIATPAFAACNPADLNYTNCVYNENLRAAGQNPSSGVSSPG